MKVYVLIIFSKRFPWNASGKFIFWILFVGWILLVGSIWGDGRGRLGPFLGTFWYFQNKFLWVPLDGCCVRPIMDHWRITTFGQNLLFLSKPWYYIIIIFNFTDLLKNYLLKYLIYVIYYPLVIFLVSADSTSCHYVIMDVIIFYLTYHPLYFHVWTYFH